MNDEQDILADALARLKGQQIPPAPPGEVVEQTLQQLSAAQGAPVRPAARDARRW